MTQGGNDQESQLNTSEPELMAQGGKLNEDIGASSGNGKEIAIPTCE